MNLFDIVVAGNGLAGKIAALALAKRGYNIALIGPKAGRQDGRTTALMDQSIGFVESLGIWDKLEAHSAALKTMQIIDGTERLLHAPTVAFRSADIGLPAFGYNFPNSAALEILDDLIAAQPAITVMHAMIEHADLGGRRVTLTLDNGESVEAEFAVAADGRKSLLRDAAGIDVRRWSYPQTAVVLNFKHTVPHNNYSTEFHTKTGPFTQVPLPGLESSLVWVQAPGEAESFIKLSHEEIAMRIEQRMQSMLGKVELDGDVQAWPLSGMTAKQFGKGRVALIGETSHVFPPIGAQGLNLSLRDIMTLCELLGTRDPDREIAPIGDAFDRKRRADVLSRTASVDLLNRSLLSKFLPVQMLRAAGLHVLGSIGPLRNLVMQEGVAPGASLRSFPSRLREKISRKHA